MDQADFELQLKVWKDLAISKQILMRTASDALGLDPDCSAEALKEKMDAAIKKAIEAEADISEAQEHAKVAIAVMEKKMAASEKAVSISEAAKKAAEETLQNYEQQMAAERAAHFSEIKKVKAQLVEKDKALKAINKALADTPENVIKKLKTLKKQKDEEAASRKVVTGEASALRKEKRALDKRVSEMKAVLEESAKQVEQYRELHKVCETLQEQLKPLVEDEKALPVIPKLDDKALEKITKAAEKEDK